MKKNIKKGKEAFFFYLGYLSPASISQVRNFLIKWEWHRAYD